MIGLSGLRLNGYPHEKLGAHDESYPCPRDTLGFLHSDQLLVFLTGMLLARYARGVRLDGYVGRKDNTSISPLSKYADHSCIAPLEAYRLVANFHAGLLRSERVGTGS